MKPEEAIQSATRVLNILLAGASESAERGYDASTYRKLLFGIEHLDALLYRAKLKEIIDQAKDDREVDAVLCGWGAQFISTGSEMPELLRNYIADRLQELSRTKGTKRGKHPFDNFTRDFAIMYVIARIADVGFKYTRSRTRHGHPPDTACSIVQNALQNLGVHMDESSVEKIWERRLQLIPELLEYIDGPERLRYPVRSQ